MIVCELSLIFHGSYWYFRFGFIPAVVAFWSKPKQQQTQGEESMVLQQEKPKKSIFLLSSIGVFIVLNFVLGIAYGPIMKIITTGLNLLG